MGFAIEHCANLGCSISHEADVGHQLGPPLCLFDEKVVASSKIG